MTAAAALLRARVICWDMDGVIKESVDVKGEAFAGLFAASGPEVQERIRSHHHAHGGLSRFTKIPVYLGWAGLDVTDEIVDSYCARFSERVRQAVVDAEWVPGVEDYLRRRRDEQVFVVVSATPQQELDWIVDRLQLAAVFAATYGAPLSKAAGITDALVRYNCPPEQAVMVGDAEADWLAARETGVAFVWRRSEPVPAWAQDFSGPSFATLTTAMESRG
jgi:phosphoglycolate phosphatase-like HAD superfamily hydrolase